MAKYDSGIYHPCKACCTDVGGAVTSVKYAIVGMPDGVQSDPFSVVLTPAFIPFLLLDLPFSLISDLVTFPYDLCHGGEEIPERAEHEKESLDEKEAVPNDHGEGGSKEKSEEQKDQAPGTPK